MWKCTLYRLKIGLIGFGENLSDKLMITTHIGILLGNLT